MIESFSFSHSGGLEAYNDEVFLGFGTFTISVVVNGKDDPESCKRVSDTVSKILNINFKRFSFDDISYLIFRNVKRSDEYILVRITDEELETEIHGGVRGYLIRGGDIVNVTNGLMALENEDRIIIGTDRFFEDLTPEAVLADAVTSFSAEEWLNFLVSRISDANQLRGKNLSAVAFIVRKTEVVRTDLTTLMN